MTYTPYLIANSRTGLDKELQPWLIPDDAQSQLLDGYVYKGVWEVREGYSQLATGERGGSTYCESRMVHNIVAENIGNGNGVLTVFDNTLTNIPVRRGTVVINYTIAATPRTATDNGLGVLTGFALNSATSTFNYTTGVIHLVFTTPPDNATAITVTYDAHQGFPVLGVMNYYTQTNTRQLLVADTTYVNRYNTVTNRLDDITAIPLTGNKTNFFSWYNYPDADNNQRMLFVNYKDPIRQYSGIGITTYSVYTASNQQTNVASGVVGDGTVGPYAISTPFATGIVPGTLSIIDVTGAQTVTDDLFGNLQGQGTGTVNYMTGAISVTFNVAVGIGNAINLTYKQLTDRITTCRHIKNFKDRAVLLSTIESGKQYGLRIRISGTGAFSDVFTTDAIGAGVIDIPDNSFITACDFNRDQLVIFTAESTWVLSYTSNDVVPFALDKIDESRGADAPYGTITYLNKTNAASTRGLIMTDGYAVARSDEKLPDYSYNEIDQDNFNLCFAGSVDEDRDHYLIHPQDGSSTSDRILVSNYEEGNYAEYTIPLSSMGTYIVAFDVTWNDLASPVYKNWKELAAVYGNWNAFAFSKGAPFSVGGGQRGEITRLNATESEDYPVKIRGMTVVDSLNLRVTTDFQTWAVNDYVYFTGMSGMVEANDKQAQINEVIDNYNFVVDIDTSTFSTYTSGGIASKVIEFITKTKQLNPFINQAAKLRCGWMYFYVSTTDTDLTDNFSITNAQKTSPCIVSVSGHDFQTGDQVFIDGVQGMTELNGNYYYVTVIDDSNISLDDINAIGFTTYTSKGFCSTPADAYLDVFVNLNDLDSPTQVQPYDPTPYRINLTSQQASNGSKKWYKIWINQVGKFIQFQMKNSQAGAEIKIHAIMPGLLPVGRLI